MTTATAQDAATLLSLVRDLAVVPGKVTLASGPGGRLLRRPAPDHAAPRRRALVGRVLLDRVADWDFDAVGGLTMGADPVAVALLHAAAERGRALDAFVVRKEGKAHGLQRRIEGPDVAGRRVLAVEDTSTTGGSVPHRGGGAAGGRRDVVGVAVIVDRDTGARQAIEAAGLEYRWLFGLDDLGLRGH